MKLFLITLLIFLFIPGVVATSPEISVELCLAQAQTKQALKLCLPTFVDISTYDFYLRRYDELLWKNEAY